MNEEELKHYGVPGMRWGHRKGTSSRDRTKYKKAPKLLTDAELKRRISRLENEKRYNDLNRRDVSQGEEITTKILKSVGTTTATTLLGAAAVYGGKIAIAKIFGEPTLKGMFPKKK